ncbi:helix-turn-helix transcriptional regulator [Streptomyces sp. NPDC046759]|uniref:helix-turn-helix transcriptional regulator n=1 Tax=Streptomyces sp. NPDC046759 TaxID=3155019 RepID=UPI0033D718AC
MDNTAQRQELADFLRARRAQIAPRDVGIEPGPRRRTPGLRREEVAQLSGVSVTWYTWLEQARDITVSRQVLDSLARALRLTTAERLYMYTLADKQGVVRQEDADAPSAELQRLVDALNPNPTYLIGPSWDLLAWNAAEAGLIGDPTRLAGPERNIIRMVFTDPETRRLLVDWQAQASGLLAQFRADAARNLGDPRFEQLSNELYAVSDEFRQLWDEHRVADFGSARWEFDHPRLGRLAVDYVRLAALQSPGVKLFTCLPADPETEAKLPGLVDPHHRFGPVGAEAVAGAF